MTTIDLKKLSAPIENVKWRVQSFKTTQKGLKAICIPYVDARDVQQRLDEVCGIENWQDRYKEVKGNLFCEIGIFIGNEWRWKSDVGTESNIEKEKGEASDSFKRAAVMWGIARELYQMKTIILDAVDVNGKKYPLDKAGQKPIYDGIVLSDYINSNLKKQKAA
ncbi:hypothetical protein CMU71_14915 [Elizabethkingia anophelis]|nr:hypothetical protein [Elizabethkingia anophelis]